MDRRYAVTISGPGWSVTADGSFYEDDGRRGDLVIAARLSDALELASCQIGSVTELLAQVVEHVEDAGLHGVFDTESALTAERAFFAAAVELLKQREIERKG